MENKELYTGQKRRRNSKAAHAIECTELGRQAILKGLKILMDIHIKSPNITAGFDLTRDVRILIGDILKNNTPWTRAKETIKPNTATF